MEWLLLSMFKCHLLVEIMTHTLFTNQTTKELLLISLVVGRVLVFTLLFFISQNEINRDCYLQITQFTYEYEKRESSSECWFVRSLRAPTAEVLRHTEHP